MVHNVISSRNADYSFYVKCDCGKEILHFAYFGETNDCLEIIAAKYYGPDSGQSNDIFTFTQSSLRKLSDHLKLSLTEENYSCTIEDGTVTLHVIKDALGFYTIKKKRYLMAPIEDWEICLRDFNIKLIIEELDKMYHTITKVREQKKIEWLENLEKEKLELEARRKQRYK